MAFYPNVYYNPFDNQGIFSIGSVPGQLGFFNQPDYNPYMTVTSPMVQTPVIPNSTTSVGQSTGGIGGGAGGTNQTTQNYGILPWVGAGLYGLNTIGNLILGWRSLNLARDQFNFQRDLANQNLAAAIQAYNTARRERLRGRGVLSEEEIDRLMEEQGIKDTRKYK